MAVSGDAKIMYVLKVSLSADWPESTISAGFLADFLVIQMEWECVNKSLKFYIEWRTSFKDSSMVAASLLKS